MSVHSDYRSNNPSREERAEYERDLRAAYARETYEEKHPYEDDTAVTCDYMGDDGSCNCDDHCVHQRGKWKDVCGVWKEREEE